jgi:arylsulfatase A-like enzyme
MTARALTLFVSLTMAAAVAQPRIGKTYKESTPYWPPLASAPKGAPNIVWIVLDDIGYGHISSFGGPIDTPNMDRLARGGLSYTNFHVTALCSPTRAAFLSGRNHHSVGMGMITEYSTGYPGYDGRMPFEKALISEILHGNGYSTFAVGKWHLAPVNEMTPAGPFDRWPLGRGFEHFYGFLGGETDQYHPDLVEENRHLDGDLHGRHLTTAMNDRAMEYIVNQQAITPGKPFFLYWASGATHAPLQAPREWIDKYQGRFDQGWDKVREETLARQKKLGIVPESVQLPPREPGIRAWDSLTPVEKRTYARFQEVFAGFAAHTDFEIGRLTHFLEDRGLLENTIIVLNVGDNGASQEGGPEGTFNDTIYFNRIPMPTAQENLKWMPQLGDQTTRPHYPIGWAMAGNTPFRRYKQDASNEGGTRDPLIIHWPARIKDRGGKRTQYHHAIDVTPTLLEAVGIRPPEVLNGYKQAPLEGVSMAYTFDDPQAKSRHSTQYYEMFSRRAIYNNGWKALVYHAPDSDYEKETWELYNFESDFNETNDLAARYPSMLDEMKALFDVEARKYNVYPLDDARLARVALGRPPLYGDRTLFTYYPGTVTLPRVAAVNVVNKSFRLTADIENPSDGVLIAFGGRFGGYSLYVKDGKPEFAYNLLAREHFYVSSSERLPAGKSTVVLDFASDGGKLGAGGTATLRIDGRLVGESRIPRTVPLVLDLLEGLDVGRDLGTAVAERYQSPFPFAGTLHKVTVETR